MFNRVNEETLWSFLQWVSWQRRPDYQPCYARIGGTVGGGLTRQRKPEREAFLAVFSPKHCASTRLAIKKALMLCIKAFPCRHSGEKIEGESNGWTRSDWMNSIPVSPSNSLNLLFGIFRGCFIETWTSEKNKTRRQNVFGSRVVDVLEKRSKV